MSRTICAVAPCLLTIAFVTLSTGCSDDTEKRLSEALVPQGVKSISVTEEKVTATCGMGGTVDVPDAELERNFLGMAKTSKVTTVAKNILRECEDKDAAQRQADAVKARIAEETQRLGIDATGLDEAAVKKAICDKLTAALPLKDPNRTEEGVKNTQRWGCDAPSPPPEPPAADGWLVEMGKPQGKKPVPSFLRLQNDAGEKLTVRCNGKKADFYVQPATPAKKGTKVVEVRMDGGRPSKWKVKPSTDGKALFFVDLKPAFKAMSSAKQATFTIPAKKPVPVTFAVKGFSEAAKQLPKACQ